MGLWEFFYRYFIEPIVNNEGYNVVNTLTYAVILGIGVVVVYRALKRAGISTDRQFFKALLPYIALGALMRAMTDATIYPRTYLTVTPGIYFMVTAFTSLALYVSHRHCRGCDWQRAFFGFGIVLLLFNVFVLGISYSKVSFNWEVLKYFIPALVVAETSIWLLTKKVKIIADNSWLFYAHFYDATTTFVGVDFMGYWEQHVLSRFFIEHTGTAATMYILKFVMLLLVVYLIDHVVENEAERDMGEFVKLVIFLLGFAPGTRNLLRMFMGV
ncbi:DUF63 family protein [Thermococcus piezophilus]|uniref:DUF63 family protein n=1 Tax=Thermococcus piezophilus TaxID=1712654 RepID=A0A172WER5_9EURY|nr:DUF63 family protein [Thermococcus piezophilus]ANF21885.1 hypothetical protein A7C91_00720 [Thermococcus piezophilus]